MIPTVPVTSDGLPLLMDKLIVVDIEATCWKGTPPPEEQNEIIEVGVCLLDLASLVREGKQGILVQPTRSAVSPFCTRLTSITPEMAAGGVSFAAACEALREVCLSPQRLWGSWGDYDRKMFETQCASFGVAYPFSDRYVNLKTFFVQTLSLKKSVGMARAMKMTGFPMEGTHHRGGDDAWNIAQLVAYVLGKHPDALVPYFSAQVQESEQPEP